MPSSPAPARHLYVPGPDFAKRKIPTLKKPGTVWFRIHRSDRPAVQFGIHTHHRFSHPESTFPVLYLGAEIRTCLWEYFGDDVFGSIPAIASTRWQGCHLSRIEVPPLKVCALDQQSTRDALRVDKASLLAADLSIPQAWARAIQQHPEGFDAIQYTSRFVEQSCLALFGQPRITAQVREVALGTLDSLDAAVDWLDERGAALV